MRQIEVEGHDIFPKARIPYSCPTIRNARLFVDSGQVYAPKTHFFSRPLWFSHKHEVK